MNRYRDSTANAEITLNYVNGLLAVQGDGQDDRNAALEDALSYCYSYLIQKKVQWSIHVEKLAQLFLQLAFETQKHAKIKQVLKQYRAITQNQHPQSLRHILEYFRDNKIQTIIEDQIPQDSIDFIRSMRNIEDDQASSEIILSSFNPDVKNKRQKIRQKLKIVWQGYKAIIDTVRVNQKLQTVYRVTLKKIFEFVDNYNRKGQFKAFCEYLRTGLKIALNKRDKTEQQKGFYIDIEKQQVNTNNIQIRLEQFNVTTKLGLWQQAFQILQDIKQLIRIRKGPVKNIIKCSYFEKLALIFRKSNYWHYHAYAFYNYYTIYITKSKLSTQEKLKLSDRLMLSVLCIPPSTLQSHQSKESQQKIGQMMIYGTKIPDRQHLQNMMISNGIVQNASQDIKDLWYFMFLQFDLSSLKKGLQMLKRLQTKQEYKQYVKLLEDILIYKQLISVAQVYQKMKYSSLISLIPLPKQKIQKVLLECHHRKVIDFTLDEKKGIISFQQKVQESNPLQEFYHSFTEIALLREQIREMDRKYIIKKTMDFINDSYNYYWSIREYKIDQYKKKLKKPKDQLTFRERQKQRKEKEQKQQRQYERKIRQAQAKQAQQKKRQQLINKKVIISDIVKIKEQRVVRIKNKKIENLEDDQIDDVQIDILTQLLTQTEKRVANDNENRNKKKFTKVDYMQREKRQVIKNKIVEQCASTQDQYFNKIKQNSLNDFNQKQNLKTMISKVAPEVKQRIDYHYTENKKKFEHDLADFKKRLDDEFKYKIWKKAKELHQINEQNKKAQQKRRRQAQMEEGNSNWSFKAQPAKNATTQDQNAWKRKTKQQKDKQSEKPIQVKKTQDSWIKKKENKNTFASLQVSDQPEEKKQSKNDWSFRKADTQKKQDEPKKQKPNQGKFTAVPISEKNSAWGKGTATKVEQKPRPQPQLAFKPVETKKKGKGW